MLDADMVSSSQWSFATLRQCTQCGHPARSPQWHTFTPPSLATHRKEVPKCVLSRQQRSVKPFCAPIGGHSQTPQVAAAQ